MRSRQLRSSGGPSVRKFRYAHTTSFLVLVAHPLSLSTCFSVPIVGFLHITECSVPPCRAVSFVKPIPRCRLPTFAPFTTKIQIPSDLWRLYLPYHPNTVPTSFADHSRDFACSSCAVH